MSNSLLSLTAGTPLFHRTQWFRAMLADPDHQIFPDRTWLKNHKERDIEVVNIGSSGARWAFDYADTGIKAMNWGWMPQTLQEDFGLLRHFHSILKPNATVIITIMPFSGLNKATGLFDAMKYAHLDIDQDQDPIQPHLYNRAKQLTRYPILFGGAALKALVRYLLGRERKDDRQTRGMIDHNPMNDKQLEADARNWIEGWKRQFSIADFDAPLTPQNQEGRNYRIQLMRQLIDFCIGHNLRPVYVIPPVTNHLSNYYSTAFCKTYIYDFLSEVERDIPLYDYSKDETFSQDELYFNSFFLNQYGRRIFTQRVIKDVINHQ